MDKVTTNRIPRFAELDALVPSKRSRRTPDQLAQSRAAKRVTDRAKEQRRYLAHVAMLERRRIADAKKQGQFCRLVEPAQDREAA